MKHFIICVNWYLQANFKNKLTVILIGLKGVKKLPRSRTGSNYTVRCSLNEIYNRTRLEGGLTGGQRTELQRIGWGFILDYKLYSCVSRPLIISLYKKLDIETLKIVFAGGHEIAVTADAVYAVFGQIGRAHV